MQDQIDALQINLAASAGATLAATNDAAAATTALAGLPPTGTPNLGTTAPIFALSPAYLVLHNSLLSFTCHPLILTSSDDFVYGIVLYVPYLVLQLASHRKWVRPLASREC
jgi:hypothetical protein